MRRGGARGGESPVILGNPLVVGGLDSRRGSERREDAIRRPNPVPAAVRLGAVAGGQQRRFGWLAGRLRRGPVPPHAFFIGSALFHYLGPAFAVLLFVRVSPPGVAWLRIVSAAIVLGLWRRPWRALRTADRSTLRLVIALGAVLAVMNTCFYLAIARLPLGTVAAIEFLPVILLAALGVRSARNGVAVALGVAGVYILTDVQIRGQPIGVVVAFANALLFALYIVLAHRLSRRTAVGRLDGLSTAMFVAAVAITPIGGWSGLPALRDPIALGAGIGVGITSSVIPYVCDQLAMSRLSRATYSLMTSLLPATATVVGIVILAQIPTVRQLIGVGLVVAAVALHHDTTGNATRKVEADHHATHGRSARERASDSLGA